MYLFEIIFSVNHQYCAKCDRSENILKKDNFGLSFMMRLLNGLFDDL